MAYEIEWSEIHRLLHQSHAVWLKKLSRNDCGWADGQEHGHQSGFYVPVEAQRAGFFPHLVNDRADRAHIYEASLATFWPATGEEKSCRLVNYSNKGAETHCTRLPKEHFQNLTPASLLLVGQLAMDSSSSRFWIVVIDAASEAASDVEAVFDVGAHFHNRIFSPPEIFRIRSDQSDPLIEELRHAVATNSLDRFVAAAAKLPPPTSLAQQAQSEYLRMKGLHSLNPYELENPGDAIMEISRDIEYRLYKRAELRHRAADVLRIMNTLALDMPAAVVQGYPELSSSFLSASQHRKSRAGRSFEHHIERLLVDGQTRYEAQAVTGGRRPDFVMPGIKEIRGVAASGSLILSAKTTLRERWKQLALERFDCGLFLATVDDRVSSASIADMDGQGICLVVPESLKTSRETDYGKHTNVISFREFFDHEVKGKRPGLVHT